VEDVAQVAGRFGPKMTAKLSIPHIKTALFKDPTQLRLLSLKYIDSFTCRLKKTFREPVSPNGEADRTAARLNLHPSAVLT
jgi:hypothetical protein